MRKTKILVVDDEKHCRMLYREELESLGYQVQTNDGTNALESFNIYDPDVVILDIKLGVEISGLDILRYIRDAGHDTPIILNTAYDSFQHDMKSIAADAYVVKDVDLKELFDKVEILSKNSNDKTKHRTNNITSSREQQAKEAFDDFIRYIKKSNIPNSILKDYIHDFHNYILKLSEIELLKLRASLSTNQLNKDFMSIKDRLLSMGPSRNNHGVIESEFEKTTFLSRNTIFNIIMHYEREISDNINKSEVNFLDLINKLKKGDWDYVIYKNVTQYMNKINRTIQSLMTPETTNILLKDIRHDLKNCTEIVFT